MRKRIVIGVLGIIGIGILLFVISRPKPGTIEYHKREYFAARDGRFLDHVSETWDKIVGQPTDFMARGIRMDSHEAALIKLGYLEERRVVISNRLAAVVAAEVQFLHPGIAEERVWSVYQTATNELIILGLREDMAKWESLVRQADMP